MVIGIGIDVIQNDRIAQSLERYSKRFISRVFTEKEAEYCGSCAHPAIHYAARFAAKEAAFKALGTGWARGVRWKDIEVERLESGRPLLHLHGQALAEAERLGATRYHVSLAHDKLISSAVVVLESGGR